MRKTNHLSNPLIFMMRHQLRHAATLKLLFIFISWHQMCHVIPRNSFVRVKSLICILYENFDLIYELTKKIRKFKGLF